MSALEVIALGCVAAVGLVAFAFWLMMIYDCATNTSARSRERWVWLLIVVLGKLPGAVAYYLLMKRPAGARAEAR